MIRLLLLVWLLASSAHGEVRVVDGDTFVTGQQTVRIVGIDTPELGHGKKPDEPLAEEAREATRRLLANAPLTITPATAPKDRYGRLLASVQLPDGGDVGEILLQQGLAVVMIYPPNLQRVAHYLAVEAEARQKRLGVWKLPRYRLLAAHEADLGMDRYCLVTGKVVAVGQSRRTLYLNFGDDQRQDFTIAIALQDWQTLFVPYGFTEQSLRGATVLARGKIHERNGPFMKISHPLQLQALP